MQAISTMDPGRIWPYFSEIAIRFTNENSSIWSWSHDTVGNEWQSESWTFGYCDFCRDP
ncbi:MAG TPA: hypothetical protein VFY54_16370 [Rubrobacter sp.]|nr:hypothetical protein [Rubrobacter sp.]